MARSASTTHYSESHYSESIRSNESTMSGEGGGGGVGRLLPSKIL